jgi:tetratricopeptide (TPR) repeat protein
MSARSRFGVVLVALAASAVAAHPGLHHDIASATAAIDKEPTKADLYVERAYLLRLDEEYDAALIDLERARRLDPTDLRVAAERGMTLSALGEDAEAESELTRFLRQGGTAPTFAERAKVRERLGRKTDAVSDYTSAIALRPDIELFVARGTVQESLGDLAGAASGYREGRAALGDAVALDLALIRVETSRKRYASALELIDVQLGRASVKTDWYLRRADVLAAAGRTTEAAIDREAALREADAAVQRTGSGLQLYSRAKVQAALGRIEDAKHDLELALEKSPRFAEAREMLAKLATADNDRGMKP